MRLSFREHIALWSSSGVLLFLCFLFSRVLPSTFTSLNPGSWFLGSVSLHGTHIHEMGNRLGFQKSTSIDPPELLLGASKL